ncbi:hypothetical protein [Streptomyces tibetensis]|uniref:hypothetical protein n=1 Tax=Streptomyces tibetensis TaxID=2382123 RepID=UPI003F5425E8
MADECFRHPRIATVHDRLDPDRRAWEHWNREAAYGVTDTAGAGAVEPWAGMPDVNGPPVTSRWTSAFAADGRTLTSDSTLPLSRAAGDRGGTRR